MSDRRWSRRRLAHYEDRVEVTTPVLCGECSTSPMYCRTCHAEMRRQRDRYLEWLVMTGIVAVLLVLNALAR